MFFLLAKVLVREKMSGEFRVILIFIANDFFRIRRIRTEMTYVEVRYYLGTESSFFLFSRSYLFAKCQFGVQVFTYGVLCRRMYHRDTQTEK